MMHGDTLSSNIQVNIRREVLQDEIEPDVTLQYS
jgi:hypothetical protein